MNVKKTGISVRGLKFRYSDEQATKSHNVLDIDSLDLPSGGCHVILGPNGCGKTTLLKLIAGLMPPSEGHIELDSRAVLVHQHPYLLSGSVFHNVAYGLKIRKNDRREIEERVSAELESWGLTPLRDRPSSKLSGGEKQRTAIARAMILEPDFLLLDEPTASVDPDNINHMEELILRIMAGGTTVILSTHHLDFAYRIADTLIRLKKGKPVPVQENIISGRVVSSDESSCIFESNGMKLYCPARDGNFKKVVFSENDVILSTEPIKSSARNVIESSVESLQKNGTEVIVHLKAGFNFKARITSESAVELDIRPGDKIYAMLKSSSIGLF